MKDKVAVVFARRAKMQERLPVHLRNMVQKVYVTAINLNAVQLLAREIEAKGGKAEAGKVDALNENESITFYNG